MNKYIIYKSTQTSLILFVIRLKNNHKKSELKLKVEKKQTNKQTHNHKSTRT